jgi:hypothetical protein
MKLTSDNVHLQPEGQIDVMLATMQSWLVVLGRDH